MSTLSFDPTLPYRAVNYLRRSTDAQNPRSPDQQRDEIEKRLKASGLPWIIVGEYREDGVSGSCLRNRPRYQAMVQDIRTGAVKVGLILVDTLERLGRKDGLFSILKELYEKHGVLVVSVDSHFADPTTS
jgi:DNA invertase Pin-like site-specific DNA recombinase